MQPSSNASSVSLRNPHKFNIKEEMDGKYLNLWSTDNNEAYAYDELVIKSVYDPSPVGYTAPPIRTFTGFNKTGSNTSSSSDFNVKGAFDKGWYFYTKPNKQGNIIFFPACGFRRYDAGSLHAVTTRGFCWIAGPNGWDSSHCLLFYSGYVYPLSSADHSGGFAVRCAAEKM